ncbi:MAG: type I methionyl aminopeptidase [Oscillospiraceae bacterium]|jgi:methionyl aminopeptidase|nr:type I methionyl aminopeptidase [Oscillospiraceae bacterium]
MIPIKNRREIELMRAACRITGLALAAAGAAVAPGVTTAHLDAVAKRVIRINGATPAFLGYKDYPAAINASVNYEVIHGLPSGRVLKEGDIVSIDVGARYNGFIGDAAATFAVGGISGEAARLIAVTRECFFKGLAYARKDGRVFEISAAICEHAQRNGCSVVKDFTGHGVGRDLHEEPEVPNFVPPNSGRGARLKPGMCLAVEPMINAGHSDVVVLKDGWTVLTADRRLSAHYEHTVLITDGEPELLTLVEGSI